MFARWRYLPITIAPSLPAAGRHAAEPAIWRSSTANKGGQALPNMTKPAGMSDADFTKLHNETGAIFEGAIGFVALQKKDYATAQKDLHEAVSHEAQPNIADIYPLATGRPRSQADESGRLLVYRESLQLAQGAGQQQILDYAKKKYIRYHGSEQGWADLVKRCQGLAERHAARRASP